MNRWMDRPREGSKTKKLQKPRFEEKARSKMKSSHKMLRRKGLLGDFHSGSLC